MRKLFFWLNRKWRCSSVEILLSAGQLIRGRRLLYWILSGYKISVLEQKRICCSTMSGFFSVDGKLLTKEGTLFATTSTRSDGSNCWVWSGINSPLHSAELGKFCTFAVGWHFCQRPAHDRLVEGGIRERRRRGNGGRVPRPLRGRHPEKSEN